MATTTNPNPYKRLTARIQNALSGARDAVRKGHADLASDYLDTAEGLWEELPAAWQEVAAPALDAVADLVDSLMRQQREARSADGAFSYADV